jgi:hypothetical protein
MQLKKFQLFSPRLMKNLKDIRSVLDDQQNSHCAFSRLDNHLAEINRARASATV